MDQPPIILGIESSCDETSAAVLSKGKILANVIAGQQVHETYGGVVPELASREHQKNIIPVVATALKEAGINKRELSAIAYTNGPGLLGALLVGNSFAKGFAMGLKIPIIEVNHMQAHILAHFIQDDEMQAPPFPFLCLTVSGGHTQIVKVDSPYKMNVIGQTIDDAAGEAFDKIAKILGLPYPGGPHVDRLAIKGNPLAFKFPMPFAEGINFSFSGLKTSVLYFLRKQKDADPNFIEDNLEDLCASVQYTIINILVHKVEKALEDTGIDSLAIAGGVSANSGLRNALKELGEERGLNIYIPKFEYCTDNAAMVAMAGYYSYLKSNFADMSSIPTARLSI